jgi:hypothetical protein
MRSKLFLVSFIVTVAALLGAQPLARAQSPSPSPSPSTTSSESEEPEQENTRGAFLVSRPKTVEKPKSTPPNSPPPPRSRRRPTTTTKSSPNGTTANSGTIKTGASPVKNGDTSKKKPIVQKMGLGVTLFMRDANGLAVRVDPTHEFHKGDRVRVLLETNTDGHLYIFNTTDDGPAVMIYPDPQLDEAGNYCEAHVPLEIPSSVNPEENLRWFRFDEKVGVERLYFVFTREPLAEAPIEDDLLKYCGEDKTQCAWHPSPEMWAQLQKHLSIPTAVAKAKSNGKAQTGAEHQAATRGIGLARDDPEPSLVMMNVSTDSGLMVAQLDLFHR